MPHPFAVAVSHTHLKPTASALAEELHAPLHSSRNPADARFLLRLTPAHLELALGPAPPHDAPPGLTPLVPELVHRQLTRNDPLHKALGLRRANTPPTVLDATAGLLADADAIASLGCPTTAAERHPAVAALASDALRRQKIDETGSGVFHEKKTPDPVFRVADAVDLLPALDPPPDVVHLDPMFPPRRKGRPPKAMWMLHALLGDPDPHDDARLLRAALDHAARRVIVKRPRLAPPINHDHPDLPAPASQHVGKSHRYDVYPTR